MKEKAEKIFSDWKVGKALPVGLLFLVIFLGLAIRFNCMNDKNHFHIDEVFSFSYINNPNMTVTRESDFFNKWHDGDFFHDKLTVQQEERFNYKVVTINTGREVHPPVYYWFLHTAVALFSVDKIPKECSIYLNMMFFVVSMLLLYRLGNEVLKNSYHSLVVCLFWGLSVAAISNTLLARMYELAVLTTLLTMWLTVRALSKTKISYKDYLFISLSVLFGFLNHYYFLVYIFFVFVTVTFVLIREKRLKEALIYFISLLLSGVASVAIFPPLIHHIFFGSRGTGSVESLQSVGNYLNKLSAYYKIVDICLFWNILFIILPMLSCLFYLSFKKSKKDVMLLSYSPMKLIFISTLLYFGVIVVVTPFNVLRYVQPILPFFMLVLVFAIYNFVPAVKYQKGIVFMLILISSVFCGNSLFKGDFNYFYSGRKSFYANSFYANKRAVPTLNVIGKSAGMCTLNLPLFADRKNTAFILEEEVRAVAFRSFLSSVDLSRGLFLFIEKGLKGNLIAEDIAELLHLNKGELLFDKQCFNIYFLENRGKR